MLKPVAWVVLLSLSAWGKPVPYRDSACQVQFPGAFVRGQQAVSCMHPSVQFYLLSWPTSTGQTFLANLYQQARSRGCQVEFVTRNRAIGMQILEDLTPAEQNLSQFFLIYGRCYEFRVSIHDGREHAEVDEFLGSIRFQARTVNVRSAVLNYVVPAQPAPWPRTRLAPANPYTF